MSAREYVLEAWLRKRVKAMGGLCFKMTQRTGIPDRLVLFPGKPPLFIELKAEGKKSTPIQVAVQNEYRAMGFEVHEADSKEKLLNILEHATRTN